MIKDAIDFEVLNSEEDNEIKADVLSYLICDRLKGVKVYMPVKKHKILLAKKWLKEGKTSRHINMDFGLDKRTLTKASR
jgi:hypothetical protein